ncbi:unnamed protein product [Phytophthora fragariaefolia]|uniref:Unnamed protein product n=1 Tax=Phytophthora fragariaefolia TaxID=1490495 RepID=A0A9W6UDS3_9STRA|nr:unnamed protein product [Phytophthora fragariaefolia]
MRSDHHDSSDDDGDKNDVNNRGDGSGRAGEDDRGRDGADGNGGERQQPGRVPAPVQTQQSDDLEEMDWWDALTPRQ